MNVYEKLQQSRIELQELNIKKSGKNKFSGFCYYELSDFLPHINNIFNKIKLCATFNIEEDIATLLIINIENPEETISFKSRVKEVELKGCSGIQGIGAQHTYMRRYLYINALEIVENDILDAKAGTIENYSTLEREIGGITNVEQLNEIYERYKIQPPKDPNCKLAIKAKADYLGVIFDKEKEKFI